MKLIMLLLMLFTAACSSSSKFKTDQEYWRETDFELSYVEDLFDDMCEEDDAHFFACVEALNHFLAHSKDGWFAFVSSKGGEKDIFSLPKFYDGSPFPNVKWVKRSEKTKPLVRKLLINQEKTTNQSYKDNWVNYHNENNHLPFLKIFEAAVEAMRKEGSLNVTNEHFYASEAYDAYLEALIGPYSYLVTRDSIRDRQMKPNLELQGIGVELSEIDDGVLVGRVIEGGPAYKAGIFAGDIFTDIRPYTGADFVSLKDHTIDEAMRLIRGEAGSQIVAKVKRGKDIFAVEMIRDEYIYSPVQGRVVDYKEKKYLLLNVMTFYTNRFCEDIKNILEKNKPYEGIVLNLRGNGGGAVESAYCLAEMFLKEDSIIETALKLETDLRDPNDIDHDEEHEADDEYDTETPLVVMIDRKTASASEVVAAALQDHHRALIVGERSLGKGTGLVATQEHPEVPYMQRNKDIYFYYANDFGLRPKGTHIEADGVTPDIYMKRTPLDNDVRTKTKRQIMLEEFPWSYVYDFSQFPKWKMEKEDQERNQKIKTCVESRIGEIEKSYQALLKEKKLELPDFELLQALESFLCRKEMLQI